MRPPDYRRRVFGSTDQVDRCEGSHRVIEQIVHDFLEPPFIGVYRGKVVGNLQFKPQIFSSELRFSPNHA